MMMQFLEMLGALELEQAIVFAAVFIVELHHKIKNEMDTPALEDQAFVYVMTITLCERLESRFTAKDKDGKIFLPEEEEKEGKGKGKADVSPLQMDGNQGDGKRDEIAKEDIPPLQEEEKNSQERGRDKAKVEILVEILAPEGEEKLAEKNVKENILPSQDGGRKLNGKGKEHAKEETPSSEDPKKKWKGKGKEKITEESPSASKNSCRQQ
jgi:hypothetical protein